MAMAPPPVPLAMVVIASRCSALARSSAIRPTDTRYPPTLSLRPSMHSTRRRERAGVGAEPANGLLPHLLGGCVEQQVGIDVAQEP